MSQWVIEGIRTGIKTTAYPRGAERAAGVTPGLPRGGDFGAGAAALVARCLTERSFRRTGHLGGQPPLCSLLPLRSWHGEPLNWERPTSGPARWQVDK